MTTPETEPAVRALVEQAKAEALLDAADPIALDHATHFCGWRVLDHDMQPRPVDACKMPTAVALADWLRARADSLAAQPAPEEGCSSCGLYGGGHAHPDCEAAQPAPEAATVEEGRTAEKDLTIRTTSTGVEVIEGDCPHCGHAAMDHWSDGCKGARGGADHCRMDPWKLKRLARVIPPGSTKEKP